MDKRLFDLMGKINPEMNKQNINEGVDPEFNIEQINSIVSPETESGYRLVIYNGKTGKSTKWLTITKEQLDQIKQMFGTSKDSGVPNYADFSLNENVSNDPTKEEMYNHLKNSFGADFDDFSAEEAIYWFCYDYHNGQSSNTYSALSTSKYKPSPLMNSSDELDDDGKMMYDELVSTFG